MGILRRRNRGRKARDEAKAARAESRWPEVTELLTRSIRRIRRDIIEPMNKRIRDRQDRDRNAR